MKTKTYLAAALALLLGIALQPAPGQSPQSQPSIPDGQRMRETIDTFRTVLLRQFLANQTIQYGYSPHGLPNTTSSGVTLVPSQSQNTTIPDGASGLSLYGQAAAAPRITQPDQTKKAQSGSDSSNWMLGYYSANMAHINDGVHYWAPTYWNAGSLSTTAEGTYLPRQGVLYLATVHSPQALGVGKLSSCTSCHDSGTQLPAAVNDPNQSADAEWDRATSSPKQKLHSSPDKSSDKQSRPQSAQQCLPSTLADKLINLLASHGHRFTDLRPEERITIQLHVRSGGNYFSTQLNTASPNVTDLPIVNYYGSAREAFSSATTFDPTQTGQGLASSDPLLNRQTSLAELHLRENNLEKAAEAYRKVLSSSSITAQTKAEAERQLAAILIRQGKIEEARSYLDLYTKSKKADSGSPDAKPQTARTDSNLSKKEDWCLTVSATKGQCDAVRSGKITLADFAGQVTIQSPAKK